MLRVGRLVYFFLHAHLNCKAGPEAEDYHGQMNATNFEKWGATFHLSQ